MSFIDLSQHQPRGNPSFIKTVMAIIERLEGQAFTCCQIQSIIRSYEEYSRYRDREIVAIQQVVKDIRRHYPEFNLQVVQAKPGPGDPATYVRPVPEPEKYAERVQATR